MISLLLGEWVDDLRNGQGKYTYTNGDTYEGEWSNNLRHGKGSYTFSATGAKYVGNWVNGRKEGPGELLYANYKYNGLFAGDQVRGGVASLFRAFSTFSYCSLMGLGVTRLISAASKRGTISWRTR